MTTQRESSNQGSSTTGTVPGQQRPYAPGPNPSGTAPGYGQGPGYPGYSEVRDPRLAEPWRRFVGWLIDAIIVGVVGSLVWVPAIIGIVNRVNAYTSLYPNSSAPGASSAAATLSGQIVGIAIGAIGIVVVIDVAYYWLLTGLWGTTVGKRAVGTWVVTSASWTRPGMGAAFVRALVFVVGPAIIGLFFLVDNLWLLWDRDRQCLHDKAASTLVVKGEAIGR